MLDNRGQMSMSRAVMALVIALAVGGLITAFMLPIGIDAMVEDTDVSFTDVSEGDENEVIRGILNVTLDNIAGTDNISVTLTDVETGNTASATNVTVATDQTVTLEGSTLTISADAVETTTADFTISYPIEYGFSDGAQSLWQILDVILVLAVFLMFIGFALAAANKV